MTSKTFIASAITIVVAAMFLGIAPTVHAQSCTNQYGGTQTCPSPFVTINKMVWSPSGSAWVDNLDSTQPFVPADKDAKGETKSVVKFLLKVTNSNPNRTYKAGEIKITDNFPYFLRLISGRGTVEGSSVSFVNPEDIAPGETKQFTYEFQVKPSKEIPGPTSVCMKNIGVVSGADTLGNEDKAQICFGDIPAKQLPVAGFNDTALLIPFIALAASGLILATRKSA